MIKHLMNFIKNKIRSIDLNLSQRKILKKLSFLLLFTFIFVFVLFYLMAQLISKDHDLSRMKMAGSIIEFSMTKVRSKTIEKKRQLPLKKKEIKPPKFKPIKPNLPTQIKDNTAFNVSDLVGQLKMEQGAGISDLTPLVRIQPQYPIGARMKGIEGWVILKFNITERGTTSHVKVLQSQPPRVFDQAAVGAVLKWKYRPKIENGKPVVQRGVKINLEFNLEEKEK